MGPLDVLGDPSRRSLTWTLLHFLWQGVLVAAVWVVLFRLLPAGRTQIHYLLGLGGTVVLAACPVVTLTTRPSAGGHAASGRLGRCDVTRWPPGRPGTASRRPRHRSWRRESDCPPKRSWKSR